MSAPDETLRATRPGWLGSRARARLVGPTPEAAAGREAGQGRIEPVLSRTPAKPAGTSAPRRDPAPSRVVYRLHRLWLTPLFRALLRRGLPIFAVVLGIGIWFHDEAHRAAVTDWAEGLRQSIAERPEFMVQMMRIEGASPGTADQIRQKLGLRLPLSSFEMDLEAMQASLHELDAVESAQLHIRKGGVLEVAVTERQPVVIWRSAKGIGTLDSTGHPVAPLLSRLERPDLPLIVGEGADKHVRQALELLAVAGPIRDRIRGLIRVGERRWDVVVEPSIRLMLPDRDPVSALEQIIALHQAQDLLDRDITAVDLRNPQRATVRLNAPAAETYRQTSAALSGAARP
ncbi:cell division protein FtsQ/DivIB [Frigidibacter sp. ROC022]|uniref:cell division protein FtsQ/DivIB n=1 Tax=Frigidibacter sp. ROC022 TaxID=2971796 RepID=UPI00215B3252|nr:cell division protein FtsQ/DivIB [Frigidibacter sp. ROC022]MCR8725234.1 cell division protein FtsQ/DivIB [Frigidibacter sp. ROC022]